MGLKRILITGGSGFIGTNLVEYFLNWGCEVQSLDIAPPLNERHFKYWKKVDILDRNLLIKETLKFQPDVFLHFAARTDLDEKIDLDGYAANIDGVCHVVDAVRSASSINRVIFASSQLVCRLGYQPENEYDYRPTTLYGRSKVLTEKIIHAAQDMGAPWTILRPTSIWGPWFDVPYRNFFTTIAKNRYVHPRNVKIMKQWGFVGNTVYQIGKLLEAAPEKIHARTFYLADYEPVDLKCFADSVQEAFYARPVYSVPLGVLRSAAQIGDIFHRMGWRSVPLTSFRLGNIITSEVAETDDLKKMTGPLPYTMEEGVQVTVRWMENGAVARGQIKGSFSL